MIGIGDAPPDFTLLGLDGLRYSLHEAAEDQPVLPLSGKRAVAHASWRRRT